MKRRSGRGGEGYIQTCSDAAPTAMEAAASNAGEDEELKRTGGRERKRERELEEAAGVEGDGGEDEEEKKKKERQVQDGKRTGGVRKKTGKLELTAAVPALEAEL